MDLRWRRVDGHERHRELMGLQYPSHWSVLRFDLGPNWITGHPITGRPIQTKSNVFHYTTIGLPYKRSNQTPPFQAPFGPIEFLRNQLLKTDGPPNGVVFSLVSRN
jgi:hypothetical protein